MKTFWSLYKESLRGGQIDKRCTKYYASDALGQSYSGLRRDHNQHITYNASNLKHNNHTY